MGNFSLVGKKIKIKKRENLVSISDIIKSHLFGRDSEKYFADVIEENQFYVSIFLLT